MGRQKGTNENTKGLLREYLPKYQDISPVSDELIASFVDRLNLRPHKCLGWPFLLKRFLTQCCT